MSKKVLVACIVFGISTFVFATSKLVDLDVSEKKAMGQAKGHLSDKDILQRQAIADALKGEAGMVLVEIDFFYEEYDDSVKVIVTGFPARYTNSRSESSSLSNENAGSAILSESPANSRKDSQETSSDKSNYQTGLYVSTKVHSIIPWSPIGGNFQIGGIVDKLFIAADFGVGKNDKEFYNSRSYYDDDYYYRTNPSSKEPIFYCGNISVGGRSHKNEWVQFITGASVGFWSKEQRTFTRHSEYERKFVLALGPSFKTLIGAKNYWFEISNRFVFGYSYAAYSIEAGFTYAPSGKPSAVKR
jgi:hypothetical protein